MIVRNALSLTISSLRAWRAVKHNVRYAKKLQKKKESEARAKALKEKEALEAAKKGASANPFTVRTRYMASFFIDSMNQFGPGIGINWPASI